jgi:hypothetical protein
VDETILQTLDEDRRRPRGLRQMVQAAINEWSYGRAEFRGKVTDRRERDVFERGVEVPVT